MCPVRCYNVRTLYNVLSPYFMICAMWTVDPVGDQAILSTGHAMAA